jgi:KDO2-lipid IV(A) lauroyltransferase
MPFRMLYVLSDILFFPFYFVIRYRRKIVRKNLTESFPNKGIDEIRKIEKNFYHFFIDMTLESCKLMTIAPEELKQRVKFINIERVNEMLAEGKSVAAFLGHYGNWEWITSIGLWLHEDAVVAQIYHKLRNKSMDKIMKRLRERMGTICVEMHKTVRFMADETTDNRPAMIGFIADQSPKRREVKYFIPFLNHQTPVLTGTEKAIKHYGYNAIFISMRRVKRGYYECELTSLHDNPTSLPDFELTNLYFQRLEYEIQQHPEFYLWTHNRFKYAINSDKTNN